LDLDESLYDLENLFKEISATVIFLHQGH